MANLSADPNALARSLVRGATGTAPTIIAPCCGRRTDPDSVLDVRMVPGITHDFLCDGCRHRLVADERNGWTHSRLARAAGLGWPEVREHRIRELMVEEMRRDGRMDRQETFKRLQAETPARDISGTEAPPGIASVRRPRR